MKENIGWIIFGTLCFYLLSIPLPFLLPLPTLLAWMVPLLMWQTLGKSTRNQALSLLLTGSVALIFSASQGVFLGFQPIFATNVPLLAMFVAISFLSLTNPGIEDPSLPQGNKAVITTTFGTHLLGGVINMSVLFVFGDRLQKKGSLSQTQLIILARAFCAAAWWSPFFIATGVAITYAPEMEWKDTLVPGVVMSIIAITYSIVEVCFIRKADFYGYPVKIESMIVPVFLATVVIMIHGLWSDISILLLICLLSPTASFLFMKGRPRRRILINFIGRSLGPVTSQFALFLAAGVFSTGLKSITNVYPTFFQLQFSTLTPGIFTVVSAVMILVGIIGVHPIISIAIVSPLLLPLNPDHSQLGFLFLTSWAISTGSSPLSGVGLALVSRYRASTRGIIQNNWHYAIAMWAISSIINYLFFG